MFKIQVLIDLPSIIWIHHAARQTKAQMDRSFLSFYNYNYKIKSIFSANVSHIPGLCLLHFGCTRYITCSCKIMFLIYGSENYGSIFSHFYVKIFPDSRPSYFVKIILKFHQTFRQYFENGKIIKICFLQIASPKLLKRLFLDIVHILSIDKCNSICQMFYFAIQQIQ